MPKKEHIFLPELCVYAKTLVEITAFCKRGNSHGLQIRLSADRGLSPVQEYVGPQDRRSRNKRKQPAKTYVISISKHDRSYAVRPHELSVERKWREGKKRTYSARVLARLTLSLREADELEVAAETHFRKQSSTLSDLESIRGRISRCVARIEKHAKRIDSAVSQANLGESFSGWCASRNGIFPVDKLGALDPLVNENLRIRAAKVAHSIVKHNRLMARADNLVAKLWTFEAAVRRDALDKLWCEIKSAVLDFSIKGELSLDGINLNVFEGEKVSAFIHEKILDPTVEAVLSNNTSSDSEEASTEEEAEPEARNPTFEIKLRYAKTPTFKIKLRYAKIPTKVSAGPEKDGTSEQIAAGPTSPSGTRKSHCWPCQPCQAKEETCVKKLGHYICLSCMEYSLACEPQEKIKDHAESSLQQFQAIHSDTITRASSGQLSSCNQSAHSVTLPTLSELAHTHFLEAGKSREPGSTPETAHATDEAITSYRYSSSVSQNDEAIVKYGFENAFSPDTSLAIIDGQDMERVEDFSTQINGSVTELCMEQTRLMKASQSGLIPGCLDSFTSSILSDEIINKASAGPETPAF